MNSIVSGTTGIIHLAFAVTALVTGMYMLVTVKGTRRHRLVGYVYSVSMIMLNLTAFLIYELYGRFGIFHWFAIVSVLTLFGGLYPVFRNQMKTHLILHFSFMYWSVIGLYCAFVAEIFSRLPKYVVTETGQPMTVFYKLVGLGTALVMLVGIVFYIRYKPRWKKQFGIS